MQSDINIVHSWQKAHSWGTVSAAVQQVYAMSPTEQAAKSEEFNGQDYIFLHLIYDKIEKCLDNC